MNKPVITIDDLSKAYRIGVQTEAFPTFREALVGAVKAPLRRLRSLSEANGEAGPSTFWASGMFRSTSSPAR